jgi:GNAT superfamily N-acetyltransferase
MLHLERLTPNGIDIFAELLGGAEFGGCFCAVWTAHGPDWVRRCGDPARPNLEVARRRVDAGEHVGFLATKLGSRLSPADADIWSIGCIAVRQDRRGTALPQKIVAAVAELARNAGARALEAYPTRPWDEPRSYRGSHRMYEQLGFQERGAERDGATEILLMRHSDRKQTKERRAAEQPAGAGKGAWNRLLDLQASPGAPLQLSWDR